MSKLARLLGFVWAAPITALGLVYVTFMALAGWYKHWGVEGNALVWVVDLDSSPRWLLSLWKRWAGHTIGNVVVLKRSPETIKTILVHEQKHVDQFMRLGIFWPILYYSIMLGVWVACPGSDPYLDNSMEIDARRAAGQVVDVKGAVQRLTSKYKKS